MLKGVVNDWDRDRYRHEIDGRPPKYVRFFAWEENLMRDEPPEHFSKKQPAERSEAVDSGP